MAETLYASVRNRHDTLKRYREFKIITKNGLTGLVLR
jgi:hypothetical protein